MRKCVIARAAVLAFCAIMVAGVAFGAQQLTLTFQEGVNGYTGTMDQQLFEDIDMQGSNSIKSPATTSNTGGLTGLYGVGDHYNITLGQYLESQWYWGNWHAALIHFPGAFEAWQALPGTPVLDNVTLTVWAETGSGDWPRYLEVSKVTDPNGDGMWKETETVTRTWWGFWEDPPVVWQHRQYDFYETDASYRSGGNPGLETPTGPTPVPWAMAHEWGTADTTPPFEGVPGDAGDHGPLVDAAVLNMYETKFLDLNVTSIFQDWINGDPVQGFHLCVGLNYTEWDWRPWGLQITSHEGALAGDPTHAPKLTIAYHYEGSSTADAGPNQGSVGDANPRVKPGEDVTLDGSGSTPLLTEYPIASYVWSWTYGTATHYLESTNDQSTAQLPLITAAPDNVSLTVTDGLGLVDTDTTQIKVTARIPGDIDGSGVVDLADFVILKNHFGQHN